ncbi:MAG: amidohydrolase family protein [Flavobacteriaceae bacterium]|nr:amidohydrolase family protein [Flavobacteriaceae bacterium]
MKKTIYIFSLVVLFVIQFNTAQQTPAPKQSKTISIVGATAHIGNGEVIENATIIFKNGIITQIGSSSSLSGQGEIIDAKNKHVYPGFIIPNSTLGLGEIGAVRATRDFDEVGEMLPHIRSLVAYNAESKVTESMRPNGVLIGQITPRGGIISGTSSIVQFDAWNWEDAAIKVDDGIHMNWPNDIKWDSKSKRIEPNKKYNEQVNKIQTYFTQANTYDIKSNKSKNIEFEALKKLFNGEQNLYVNARSEKQIIDAVDFAHGFGIKHLVIVHGDEAYKVTTLLKQNNIPVILKRVHSLPNSDDDDYDLPYKLASLLTKGGIIVALEANGGMERMNSRNLPFYAGTTSGYGLTDEEALQLITINPAKILGIDDKYGSLEVGKSATLFISEGNALDMRTNILTKAYIDGRQISLETHQTKLWKRYMEKYSSQK